VLTSVGTAGGALKQVCWRSDQPSAMKAREYLPIGFIGADIKGYLPDKVGIGVHPARPEA
jgi:hypothetical protein